MATKKFIINRLESTKSSTARYKKIATLEMRVEVQVKQKIGDKEIVSTKHSSKFLSFGYTAEDVAAFGDALAKDAVVEIDVSGMVVTSFDEEYHAYDKDGDERKMLYVTPDGEETHEAEGNMKLMKSSTKHWLHPKGLDIKF